MNKPLARAFALLAVATTGCDGRILESYQTTEAPPVREPVKPGSAQAEPAQSRPGIDFAQGVPPSEGGSDDPTWPNEPSGSTVITDCDFDDDICTWVDDYKGQQNAYATVTRRDGTTSRALDANLPVGASNGNGSWGHGLGFAKDLYVGLLWSTNSDFEGLCNNGNKMFFARDANIDNSFIGWFGFPGQPKTIKWAQQAIYDNCHVPGFNAYPGPCIGDHNGWFEPNMNPQAATVNAGSGQHLIELRLKSSTTTTSKDGMLSWWVDGVLAGHYTGVNLSPNGFDTAHINHTWDGSSCLVPPYRDLSKRWDHYWDRVRISRVNGG
jgi:hypothetical protein